MTFTLIVKRFLDKEEMFTNKLTLMNPTSVSAAS